MSDIVSEDKQESSPQVEEARILWQSYLTGDRTVLPSKVMFIRRVFEVLPHDPRCKVCNAPFAGLGGAMVRPFGFGAGRSSFNYNLCDRCEKLVKKFQVGVEIELTMLFADVRNSTTLAEEVGPSAFHQIINRYYQASTDVLNKSNALINRLIGDALIGLYVPGIAGVDHGQVAVQAATELQKATGHADQQGPWIQVGIGVHTGTAYVGAVGTSGSVSDITVLGDPANTAARLSSQAADGEILVSDETTRIGTLGLEGCEQRTLHLKGRSEPVAVRVIHVAPD